MNSIKIVSDGTPLGTKTYNSDGAVIEGITDIRLHIGVDTLMTATLSFVGVELEAIADWSNHPFKQWANSKTGMGRSK